MPDQESSTQEPATQAQEPEYVPGPMPIDLINTLETYLHLQEDHGDHEICTICQEALNNGDDQLFELNECKHSFHTNCIVSWFRSGQNRCPLCCDKGINVKNNKESREKRAWWTVEQKLKSSRFLSLKALKNKPKQLQAFFDKFNAVYVKYAEGRMHRFCANLKNPIFEGLSYKEGIALEKHNNIKRRRIRLATVVLIDDIMDYPIVPLIIPVKKVV